MRGLFAVKGVDKIEFYMDRIGNHCNLYFGVFMGTHNIINEFSHIIKDYLCLKCFIFTKISQIMFLIKTRISVCLNGRCDYRLWKVLNG